jgi:hypothetical protein|tara:strand:+ start:488 stop:700 length:213 start_codon:yes stop_codon:yes gene_type:complete
MDNFDFKKYLAEGKLTEKYSITPLETEKQGVITDLLRQMQDVAFNNPEEHTRDFLNKIIEIIEELKITDF